MKKAFFSLALSTLLYSFAACSSDGNEPEPKPKPEPEPDPETPISRGMFVCNQGSYYSGLTGSLSYIDFNSHEVSNNVFFNANNAYVGDTLEDGIIYGDYAYLLLTDSQIIHVVDRNTYKLVASIDTKEFNGGPRHVTSYNGKLYITTFGQPGYVIEVDPEQNKITRSVEVGTLPEFIATFNNTLYVAVSNGYYAHQEDPDAYICMVNPTTLTVSGQINGIVNPVQLATNGQQLFVCSWGWYQSEYPWEQKDYGIYEIKNNALEFVYPATAMALNNTSLYFISDPYVYSEESQTTYGIYNTSTKSVSAWIAPADAVEFPTGGMAVDPESGTVFIASYNEGEGGFASYNSAGYIREYSAEGNVLATYNVGITPQWMFLNSSN